MDFENTPESLNTPPLVIIKYDDGTQTSFGDPTKVVPKLENNPDLYHKLEFPLGNKPHELLKWRFDRAMNASSEELSTEERGKIFREIIQDSYNNLFEAVSKDEESGKLTEYVKETNYFLNSVIENFPEDIVKIFKEGLEYSTVNHSVNLMALSLNIKLNSKKILENLVQELKEGKVRENIAGSIYEFLVSLEDYSPLEIAQAALLHDIGKAKQQKLFNSTDKIGRKSEKFERIKKHPKDGVDLQKSMGIDNQLILSTAHNHHRRASGIGYPEISKEYPLTEFHLWIGLIDSYEAMTSILREYKQPLSARNARKELLDDIIKTKDKPLYRPYQYILFLLSLGKDKEVSSSV